MICLLIVLCMLVFLDTKKCDKMLDFLLKRFEESAILMGGFFYALICVGLITWGGLSFLFSSVLR